MNNSNLNYFMLDDEALGSKLKDAHDNRIPNLSYKS